MAAEISLAYSYHIDKINNLDESLSGFYKTDRQWEFGGNT